MSTHQADTKFAIWCSGQLAQARKRAQERMGKGWDILSPELQSGLTAREVLFVISSNDSQPGWEKAGDLAARFFWTEDKP